MSGPVIRIELEQMKFQIMHHLSQHHSRMEASIAEQLQQVVENFDYAKAVEAAAKDAIAKTVRDAVTVFFVIGAGRQVIAQAVQSHLAKTKLNTE